ATTEPQSALWEKLAQLTGLSFMAPRLRLAISGTPQAPSGSIQLQAAQIKLRKLDPKIPALDNVDLTVRLDRQIMLVNRCQFLLQGQAVRLSGELPLGETFRSRRVLAADWKQARGHLQIENAQLAAFTPLLPQLLSPQGELNLDVNLQPETGLSGQLTI